MLIWEVWLHENKSSIKIPVSGICTDRNMSFVSCVSRIPDGYWDRSGHGRDYRDLCDFLYGWWISGGKDHQERQIPLGRSGRTLLFHSFGNCFVYRRRKLGYESGTYDNNSLYVSWRGYAWRNVILIKKCFYLSGIYAILCPDNIHKEV